MQTQVDGRARTENRAANHAVISASGQVRGAKVPVWVRARGYTEEILAFWAGIMRDPDEHTAMRIRASENLIDRAWGKAPIIVAGDETQPIRVDLRAMPSERVSALELALMGALGESIAQAALPPHAETPSPSPPHFAEGAGLGGMIVDQGQQELPSASPTKGQHNMNESAPSENHGLFLDGAALQHGEPDAPGESGLGLAAYGGEGGCGE